MPKLFSDPKDMVAYHELRLLFCGLILARKRPQITDALNGLSADSGERFVGDGGRRGPTWQAS
jgi:hypothetical protein